MTTAVRDPQANSPGYVAVAQRRARRATPAMLNDGPWRRVDRVIVLGGCVLGLLGLGICSWGGSGEIDLSVQMRWLLGGIFAVTVSSLSLAFWLFSGLRMVRLEMARLHRMIHPAYPEAAAISGGGFVTVAGMVRYHRADCPLVAGKNVRVLDAATIAAESLRECGACGVST